MILKLNGVRLQRITIFVHYTEDLRAGKRRKLLLSSEQVLVRVGQLPVELLQLREPPPHDHLLHIFWVTLGHKLRTTEEKGQIIYCLALWVDRTD